MIKEICSGCGKEVIESKKLDSKVWDCLNCGLEEYKSVDNLTEETNKEYIAAKRAYLEVTEGQNIEGPSEHIKYMFSPSKRYALNVRSFLTPKNEKKYTAYIVDLEHKTYGKETGVLIGGYEELSDLYEFINKL